MIFTSFTFVYFFLAVLVCYWALHQNRMGQNILLLGASYLFYGWVAPWFCLLIACSTVLNYLCVKGIERFPARRKLMLWLGVTGSMGLLGWFKYFNFFAENVYWVLSQLGMSPDWTLVRIILPVGISFFTFQSLSYTIDVYRGHMQPRQSLLEFALFVSFFPQLVAGPIERANRFLPQIENRRTWCWQRFEKGVLLIVTGYFKKLVIADNVSFYVDKIYMLDSPGLLLFAIGTLVFSVQIYADFSGYTDIARGAACLLGFELTRNFRAPYAAVNPSDFWQRWHISLSSWIRDYVYIPLGGSRNKGLGGYIGVVMITMTLCGLWHGAAWNFVLWGTYHGLLLIIYRLLGLGGRWRPSSIPGWFCSWLVMFLLIVFGWSFFRAPSMTWWFTALSDSPFTVDTPALVTAIFITMKTALLVLPLVLVAFFVRSSGWRRYTASLVQAGLILCIVIFHNETGQDFIYFAF